MMKPGVALALACALGLGLPSGPRAAALEPGAAGWVREYPQPDGSPARSCATCHGRDLTLPGRQVNTGKAIEPLAPSVVPQRLGDPEKVEKWLQRNCRWTLGRTCTTQEKADFIGFIRSQ